MTTIDDLLAEITAREKTVKILLRQDMLAEHARLDAELVEVLNTDAEENRDPLGPALAQRLVDYEEEIEAAKRAFLFRAVGKKPWADLLAQHPPTKEQTNAVKEQTGGRGHLDHNPETFPIAAITASCIDVDGLGKPSEEQVTKLVEKMTIGQFDKLWAACLDANVGGFDSPKSPAAGPIARVSAALERSAMGMDEPSLARSSSAE